ncbi:hypothetical protein BU17DRAFT_70219 [Hysterangium stoloniferum]|nr:hypothetical protein BU17DRAFT_70219 [Hysterangium stoloniferum]
MATENTVTISAPSAPITTNVRDNTVAISARNLPKLKPLDYIRKCYVQLTIDGVARTTAQKRGGPEITWDNTFTINRSFGCFGFFSDRRQIPSFASLLSLQHVDGKVNLPRTSFSTTSLFNYNPVPSGFIPFTLNGTTLWFLDPHKCEALFNRHFDNCRFVITAAHNHYSASVDPILTFHISDTKYASCTYGRSQGFDL